MNEFFFHSKSMFGIYQFIKINLKTLYNKNVYKRMQCIYKEIFYINFYYIATNGVLYF